MVTGYSFNRVNSIGIFLIITILFSSIANFSYETYAINSNIESNHNLDQKSNTIPEQFVQPTSINHYIDLSESMKLSSPEERKNLNPTNITDEKNIKSITFEEGLHFSTDTSQHESKIISINQFLERQAIMERIFPLDRPRNTEKLSIKNSIDNKLHSISSDNIQIDNEQYSLDSVFSELILNNDFEKLFFNSDFIPVIINNPNIQLEQLSNFINFSFISDLKLYNNSLNLIDLNNQTEILILALISGLIFIRTENSSIKFYNYKKFVSYTFVILLISSSLLTPISLSKSYWGVAFGEEIQNSTTESIPSQTDFSETINPIPLNSSISQYTIPNDSINFIYPILQNYTTPISNSTEPILQNYTTPISNSTIILESSNTNSTDNESVKELIIPNESSYWNFKSVVNGSNFVGNVYEEDSRLMLEGDGYVASDGNSTRNISDLTIVAWIKPNYTKGSSEFTVVGKEKTFELTINNNVEPQHIAKFSIFDGIQWHTVETSIILGENWSHLAATFNGTVLSIYTNGTLSNEKFTSNSITLSTDGQFESKIPTIPVSSSDIVVGASLDNSRSIDDASKKFSGEINDIHIYNDCLTTSQISQLYNNSFPFISEQSNSTDVPQIIENTPIGDVEPLDLLKKISLTELNQTVNYNNSSNYTNYNVGIEFNETQSFVTIQEQELNKDLNQLTISAFIKPNYTTGSAEFTVLSKENSFVLSLNNILTPNHVVKFSVFDGISWTEVTGTSKIENWSHLIAIINDTRVSLYVNGTLEGTAQISEPISFSGEKLQLTTSDVMVSDSDLILGAYLSTTRGESILSKYFSGLIDKVFIYKEVLTDSQIQEIYSNFIEQITPKLELALLLPIELQNTTSTLSHDEIVIGNPVNWVQTIVLNEISENNIQVELPADAKDIQAEILTLDKQSFEIPSENLQVTESLLESTDLVPLEIATIEKIDDILQEDKATKFVLINESASAYTLEFETPAPYTIEEDYTNDDIFNKTVTVAHDSALHYTDVQSYTDIDEEFIEEDSEYKLYWDINGTITDVTTDPRFQVEFIDTNGNGIADKMQWFVPQLSQQVFQIFAFKNIIDDGINVRISQSSDDAEQKENGDMDLDDKSDLDIAENQIGLRFQNINIPPGSTITRAYIQFTAENNNEKDSASVDIFAENIDNANTFSKSKFDISNRKKTLASVNWYIPEWDKEGSTSTSQRTPDISTLVQEIVNRKDWSKGSTIAFMLFVNKHGDRDALTYDGDPKKSPLLHLEFTNKQTCNDLIQGKGYWKNHPGRITTILQLGPIYLGDFTVKDVNQAILILKNASAKDAKDSLRAHLLTTILNLKNGANPKILGSDINDVVKQSISFLESHPDPINEVHHDRKTALTLKDKLEDYNEKDDFSCIGQSFVLNGLIRDFKISHPDFEYIIGDDDGIVKPLLGDGNGADSDNPAHAKIGPTKTTTSAENFNQWYKNFENINKCTEFDITLTPDDGLFEFSDTTFFPIDGKLFGNEGKDHNYHFTYEMRGTFEFKSHQTIQVNADDDVWIFVNHKLIYDGGGVLPARDSGLLSLNSLNISKNLGLISGNKYDIDIFFAERHTVQSVFELETNINILQKDLSCAEQAFKINLDEKITFNDNIETKKITTNQLEFQETLDLDDTVDTTKTRAFTETFDERLTLTDRDQTIAINGAIQLYLDETLDLDDTVDTPRNLTIQLDETLDLDDKSNIIEINGIIQLDVAEKLQLSDTDFETKRTVDILLKEILDLQDSKFDAEKQLQIEFKETLDISESSQTIAVNGNIILNLIEKLIFNDSAVGLQNLKSNQILVDPLKPYYIINQDNIQLIFTQCDVALRWVFIEDGAQNVQLNYSQILKKLGAHNTVEICNLLTIDADIDDDDITETIVDFADSTIVNGSSIYNGNVILPTVTPITIPSKIETTSITSGSTTTTTTTTTTYSTIMAVELGSVTEKLTFNQPVRIEFPDQANKGFMGFFKNPSSSDVAFITTQCNEDNFSSVHTQLASGGECFIEVGSSFIIWTTHFTGFGMAKASMSTSTITTTTGGGVGGGIGGGTGGGGGGGTGTGPSTSPTAPGLPGVIGPTAAGSGGGSTKFHDITVQLDGGGRIKANNAGGSCVDTYQTMIVSSIVESLSPLKRVELRFVHEGEPLEDYTAIRMQIINMTIGENLYSVSGSIPWELMSGSHGIRYWLHAINEDLEVSDSTKYLISVKPGYSLFGKLEFDVVTIKAEGSVLKPIAYFTNEISKPVSGAISLIVDGKVVHTSQPQIFEKGETSVELEWKIPKVGKVVDYQVKVIAEFCGKVFETIEVTLSTFPRTVLESISDKINIKLFTDKLGNTVARPGSLYSSDSNPNTSFRVVSSDGTCVIGSTDECMIRDSTFGKPGNIESVTIDGQIYRIRYSGPENVVERFTITSVDPILGYWNVYKETPQGIIPKAYAENENPLKIQYRAQELKINTGYDINFQEISSVEDDETTGFSGTIISEGEQPINFFDIRVDLIHPSADLTNVLVHLSPTKTVSASETFKESLEGQSLAVSALVTKPVDFNRAELRFVNSYQSYDEYSAIKMEINDLPGDPSISILSAIIPWELISKGPAAVYWIHLQGDTIKESDKFTINVGQKSPSEDEENKIPEPLLQTPMGTSIRLTSINPTTIDKADNKIPIIDIKGELDNWESIEGFPIVDIFEPNGQKIINDIVLNIINQTNSNVWEFSRDNFEVGSLSELPTGKYTVEMSSSNNARKDSLGVPLKSHMTFEIIDSREGMGGILDNEQQSPSIDSPTENDNYNLIGIIIFGIVALILAIIAIVIKSKYRKTKEI